MIVDALTAERIGMTWLRSAVAPVGAFGRRYDESIPPYGPGGEATALAEITDVVALAAALQPEGVDRVRAALRATPEPTPILARARAGDPLADVDFYELGRFVDALAALARAWDGAGGVAARRPPTLEGLRVLLAPGRDGAGFYLADGFGAELAAARSALVAAEAAVDLRRAAAAATVRDALGIDVIGDEFVVLREAYDGAAIEGARMVRETPAYRLYRFALPQPERDAAFERLAAAEERARVVLAESIAREAAVVAAALHGLGALDRLLARVAFAQRFGGCVPGLDGGELRFEDATFVPLADMLTSRGHRYTPVSLALHGVAVLTGPNMGGKSAALATAGFLCACVALGVAPPARAATLPLREGVMWVGADAAGERDRLLSSFAAEIVRAHAALTLASPRALILVDEFARTTGAREGRALSIALIEALAQRGALALVATHIDGLADVAGIAHLRIAGLGPGALEGVEAAGLDAALDAINGAMDYRIVDARGPSGGSDALALARLLGFDDDVVARARILHDAREAE